MWQSSRKKEKEKKKSQIWLHIVYEKSNENKDPYIFLKLHIETYH
jgi:hypothetical protein